MKRKVIKLGQATYVLSLPNKWVREQQLEKGDYIEVDEQEGDLLLQVQKKPQRKAISLNFRKLNSKLSRAYLETAYLLGFDPIEIMHDPQMPLYLSPPRSNAQRSMCSADLMQQMVNDEFVGAEIVEQSAQRTVIKDLGGGMDEESMDNVFHRVLFLLNTIAKETLRALREKDTVALESLLSQTKIAHKLILYYSRLLFGSKMDRPELMIRGNVVMNLRFINATYKVILRETLRTRNYYARESLNMFEEVTKNMEGMVSLLLKFDSTRALEYLAAREVLWKKIHHLKARGKDYLLYWQLGALMGASWFVVRLFMGQHVLEKKE